MIITTTLLLRRFLIYLPIDFRISPTDAVSAATTEPIHSSSSPTTLDANDRVLPTLFLACNTIACTNKSTLSNNCLNILSLTFVNEGDLKNV